MALKANLNKEYNFLYKDLEECYWYISDIAITSTSGIFGVFFILTAYTSRESKTLTLKREKVNQLSIGGSTHYNNDGALYEWSSFIPFNDVFLDGKAPISLDELKSKTYQWIKNNVYDISFSDVLEDGQSAY